MRRREKKLGLHSIRRTDTKETQERQQKKTRDREEEREGEGEREGRESGKANFYLIHR